MTRLKMLSFFLFSILGATSAFAADQLLFAVDIIRHGDRTPIFKVPTAPYHATEGTGQLTALGMRQEYELGLKLRALYVDEHQLLPAQYKSETLYARSTDTDRTIMSAQTFLMGLYPPGTGPSLCKEPSLPAAYQPIPIHTTPRPKDDLFISWHDSELHKILVQKHIFDSEPWKQQTKKLKPQFKRWSDLTGLKIVGLEQLIFVGDTLRVHQLHGAPLPPKMTPEDLHQIIEAGEWAFIYVHQNAKIAHASVGKLLVMLAEDLQQASSQAYPKKYYLFSGHDSTIMSLLSAMEAPLKTVPPYASRLNFSLLKRTDGRHEIIITLNDKPVFIPACGGSLCSIEQFQALAKKIH